jgi:hypothetical protein
MKIIQYKPIDKGHTKGYITLFVPAWGLNIYNITLYEKDGKKWISFPSKSYEKDGTTKWFSYLRFENQEHMAKFSNEVLKALDDYLAKQTPKPVNPVKSATQQEVQWMDWEKNSDDGLPF